MKLIMLISILKDMREKGGGREREEGRGRRQNVNEKSGQMR